MFEIRQWKSGKKSENDGAKPTEPITRRTNWPFQNAMSLNKNTRSRLMHELRDFDGPIRKNLQNTSLSI